MEIVPAILSVNPAEAIERISLCEDLVKRIQIDINDGTFLGNPTVKMEVFEKIDTSLLIDVHLMVNNPVDWVEKSLRIGADRVVGQIEHMTDQLQFISKVQSIGSGVGLALDISTPTDGIEKEILGDLDLVCVMGYDAGIGGKPMDIKAIDKIAELKDIRDKRNLKYKIMLDGGVNKDTISKIHKAGADEVAVGNYIFEGNLAENIGILNKEIGL